VCGAFGTFAHRTYTARLRGPVTSNVRPYENESAILDGPMNTKATGSRATYLWLVVVFALSTYYLYRAVNYRYFNPAQQGPDFVAKQYWYYSHLLFALPVLFGAPLQFISELRQRAPVVHRTIGKAYVLGACVAALTAIYLGGTGQYEGSRLSIVLTGLLWLFFTISAWRLAVARNYAAHRAFMIRSYTAGLSVLLRQERRPPRHHTRVGFLGGTTPAR
jgi:uncharacterized membrane protein